MEAKSPESNAYLFGYTHSLCKCIFPSVILAKIVITVVVAKVWRGRERKNRSEMSGYSVQGKLLFSS